MTDWPGRACRGMDTERFFPPDGLRGVDRDRYVRAAQYVCAGCPVRGECLTYARSNNVHHGVWGGVDMAHDAPANRAPIGHNQPYVRACAGGCGRTVATPALMQPGYHKVQAFGMCTRCYNIARGHTAARDETRAKHQEVLRQRQRGTTVQRIAYSTGYSHRNIEHIIQKAKATQ